MVNCDEEFNAKWCYSFRLSKLVTNMFGIVKMEEATTKLGSLQQKQLKFYKHVKPFNFQPPNF